MTKTPTRDEDYRDKRDRTEHEREEEERAEKDRAAEKEATTGKGVPPLHRYGAAVDTQASKEAPDPYKTYTLADFATEFVATPPAGAESGTYVATEGDAYSDPAAHKWSIDNGQHDSHGWRFTFKDGRFVEAHKYASGELVGAGAEAPVGASASSRR